MDTHLREKYGAAKALKAAIEALELLMKAQAQAPSQDQKLRLKGKFKQLMLRAEEIKKVQKQQAQEAVAEDVKKTQEEMERLSLPKPGMNTVFSGIRQQGSRNEMQLYLPKQVHHQHPKLHGPIVCCLFMNKLLSSSLRR